MSSKSTPSRGHIVLEGHNLTMGAGTGIATYARHLASTLRGLGYDTEVLVGTTGGLDRRDPTLTEVAFFDADRPPNLAQKIAIEWLRLAITPLPVKPFEMPRLGTVVGPAANRLAGFSKVHAVPHLLERERFHFKRYGKPLKLTMSGPPDLFHATRPTPVRVTGCANVYTLHDIVPLRLPYTTADDKKFYLGMIRELCRNADHIVTVSEFSRRDIIEFTGMDEKRITNTYQAVHVPERMLKRSDNDVARELEALFGLGMRDYFLFVGAIEPKKNLSRLIDAYAASGVDRPLIIAGGLGWMYDGDIEKVESERFLTYELNGTSIKPKRSVRRLQYLPHDHLISLIRGARALLFPSVYEGFGLPVLEAMTLGAPVMTSNVSSLPEIAGDAALVVDPYDVEAMSDAIRMLDADDDMCTELSMRGRIRARDFSPDIYARRMDALYASILGSRPAPTATADAPATVAQTAS